MGFERRAQYHRDQLGPRMKVTPFVAMVTPWLRIFSLATGFSTLTPGACGISNYTHWNRGYFLCTFAMVSS